VILGDVHGALDKLAESLRASALVDGNLRWKGGCEHLVFCGDLVDRGPNERGVLDLVRKLQEAARSAGGQVHVLVGNHEAMTLARDLRYVSPESYASFAPEEENSVRRKAWDGFKKVSSKPGMDEAGLKAAFEEKYLADAEITAKAGLQRGSQRAEILELTSGRLSMRGVFEDIDEGRPRDGQAARRYQHEIAAYWMDRRLGLGMVPPVILRTIDGKKGSLRAVIETAIDAVSIRSYAGLEQVERDEALRRLAERYSLDLKELMGQAARVRTFDSLIGNPGREDEDRVWIPRDRKVALVDHERAFANTVDVDQSLLCEYLDPDFRLAIRSLQPDEMQAGLSTFLSEEQISAILARRDLILKRCSPAVAGLLIRH
jgi:hypothetical protein